MANNKYIISKLPTNNYLRRDPPSDLQIYNDDIWFGQHGIR